MASYTTTVTLASAPVGHVLVGAPATTVTPQIDPATLAGLVTQVSAASLPGLVTQVSAAMSSVYAPALTASTKTAAYTSTGNEIVSADATGAAFTVKLPSAAGDKTRVTVKKIDASTNAVTVQCQGSDVLNKAGGPTTATLTLTNQAVTLQYQAAGGVWTVVGDDLPLSALTGMYAPGGTAGNIDTNAARSLIAAGTVVLYEGANTGAADIVTSGNIPAGTTRLDVVMIGSSGGGGSGACQPAGTAANGGGAGGSGGVIRETIPASALGTTWSATIGRAGAGGASVSATGNGVNGGDGRLSKFTTGTTTLQANAGGGGGGGGSGATVGAGGLTGSPFANAGGASAANGGAGNGGAAGAPNLGVASSAAGGGITTASVANNGGQGGSNTVRGYTGGSAGVVGGAAPGRGVDVVGASITSTPPGVPGPGVGGGAASITGAAQAGADAAGFGVGGGGGGASLNGKASGSGGAGIGGYLLIRAVVNP